MNNKTEKNYLNEEEQTRFFFKTKERHLNLNALLKEHFQGRRKHENKRKNTKKFNNK